MFTVMWIEGEGKEKERDFNTLAEAEAFAQELADAVREDSGVSVNQDVRIFKAGICRPVKKG